MTFIGYIETDTDRAILFLDHYWGMSEWFPKTQIDIFRHEDTHEVIVHASSWICEQKSLKEFTFRGGKNAAHRG